MSNPYVKSWDVVGTSGKPYKVSQRQNGSFACSCPAWMFARGNKPDCQHILRIRLKLQEPAKVQTKGKAVKDDIVRALEVE